MASSNQVSLVWNNLTFRTDRPFIEKFFTACICGCCYGLGKTGDVVFKNLKGIVKRGELVALMGPSGAGKSTLLNCITKGHQYQGCEGQVLIQNLNEPVRASFINQDEKDHLLLSLTVSQSLQYSSRLKNPSLNDDQHNDIVNMLLDNLDMRAQKDTEVEQCSGGQKKRLAVGMELTAMAKPHFLFLDEPTSGLDSFVGHLVMELLGNLAKEYRMAIIATIHQPSFKLFGLFDRVYILSGNGRFIFNDSPNNLVRALALAGYGFQHENPSDVAIELASAMKRNDAGGLPEIQSCKAALGALWAGLKNCLPCLWPVPVPQEAFLDQVLVGEEENAEIALKKEVCEKMATKVEEKDYPQGGQNIASGGLCKNNAKFTICSLWILVCRSSRTTLLKQKKFILMRFALHAVVAGVLALLYSRNIGKEDGCMLYDPALDPKNCSCGQTEEEMREESATEKNVKFHFFSILFLMFAALMPTVLTFPAEIKLFLNEYRNGWYTTTTYYISKTFTEILLQLIFAFLYTWFLYWFSEQPGVDDWYGGFFGFSSKRYTEFFLISALCCFIAQGLGFLIGILCVRSFNMSIIVSSSTLLFLFLFSGFFVKRVQMAAIVAWITYLSFIRFGFESILLIVYGDGRCSVPGEKASVLILFSLHDHEFVSNIIVLVVHLILIRILAFMVLSYMANPNFLKYEYLHRIVNGCMASCTCLTPGLTVLKWVAIRFLQCCCILFALQILAGIILAIYFGIASDSVKNVTININ